jgi:hypothetical protein
MTLPQPLRPSAVAMLDTVARTALAHAIGRDAAAHYDRERGRTCRRCCEAVADPSDPMGYCGPCAERDAGGRS